MSPAAPAPPSFAESRAYPARPFLAASVAVFRDGLVLLAERAVPPGARRFSLPGGLVEPGETIREAALRELREETGVEAEIVGFNDHVEVIERDSDGRVSAHFVVASFVGRWTAGEAATGPEALRTAWVAPDAVDHLATTPQLPAILLRAAAIAARG
ncbi:NUDIX domain-containing protein [Lichenibacterium minor]|uniref:NUDIX domain-containing protein n=1 Tax=Lichenibacterium minor TaxID=2316528 RepID=A0A4Q2TZG1_9HYPH|nr:NUDIX hydrolase [Lichenibacterium minor]RYC29513.1 NUDIX domain-containing protein [Lichenibacterium minor]